MSWLEMLGLSQTEAREILRASRLAADNDTTTSATIMKHVEGLAVVHRWNRAEERLADVLVRRTLDGEWRLA